MTIVSPWVFLRHEEKAGHNAYKNHIFPVIIASYYNNIIIVRKFGGDFNLANRQHIAKINYIHQSTVNTLIAKFCQ